LRSQPALGLLRLHAQSRRVSEQQLALLHAELLPEVLQARARLVHGEHALRGHHRAVRIVGETKEAGRQVQGEKRARRQRDARLGAHGC